MTELYGKYKDRGFSVFSVSIDDFEGYWARAAQELPWMGNVWQSGAWNADALSGYDVPSIPTTYLLDAQGGLRSKNVRAEDLQLHMEDLLADYGPQ